MKNGLKENKTKAIYWYQIANKLGNTFAAHQLERLKRKE